MLGTEWSEISVGAKGKPWAIVDVGRDNWLVVLVCVLQIAKLSIVAPF